MLVTLQVQNKGYKKFSGNYKMRQFKIIVILLAFLCGCQTTGINNPEKRNENWAWFIDKNTSEGMWVPIGDHTTLDDGDYTLFFCNGKIRQIGKLKNGKNADTTFYYDLTEKIISKIIMLPDSTLKEFMPDGKYKSYYSTCEISSEGEFKNNKQVGARVEYYKNGKVKFKSNVKNDTINIVNYFESGQISDSSMQVQEQYTGLATDWYENGHMKSQANFKNGKEFGSFVIYFPNGQMNQRGSKFDDMENDTIIDWYENGQMKFIRYYNKGKKEGPSILWFENGKINITVNFIEDKKNGIFKEFYENGILSKEGEYSYGKKIKAWKYYDKKGKLVETRQN